MIGAWNPLPLDIDARGGFAWLSHSLHFLECHCGANQGMLALGFFQELFTVLENHITHRSALSHQQNTPMSVCICNCIHGDFLSLGVGDLTAC